MKKEEYGPLILLCGEEEYLISDWVRKIKEALVDPGLAEFNLNLFYGSDLDMGELLSLAQTFPLLSEKRVIILKEGDLIPAKELEKLIPYIESPLASTCLLFLASKVDMRKSFYIRFKEKGKIISCQKLYENQVAPWIRNQVKQASFEIEENAVLFLKTEIGSDLIKLSTEIEKLISYVGERKMIRFEDCEKVIRGERHYSIFDLVNAVGNKNRSQALTLFVRMIDEGEQPLVMLAMLVRNFRNLLRLAEFKTEGFSRMEISKRLGIPEFYLSETYKHASAYTSDEIRKGFSLCLETDLQLKNNVRSPERTMETLILALCRG
jgi:DNA polymerase-3 subunit delta